MQSNAVLVLRGLLLLVCLTILSGCAGYNITLNGEGHGYDVYKPEPYLLIKPATGKVDVEIIWLPNYSQRYRIKTWNFLAKADFEFNIENGWQLTKISDKSDTTTIPSKFLDILQQATKAGTIALTGQPQLFRLVYNTEGVFIGLKPVPVIEGDD